MPAKEGNSSIVRSNRANAPTCELKYAHNGHTCRCLSVWRTYMTAHSQCEKRLLGYAPEGHVHQRTVDEQIRVVTIFGKRKCHFVCRTSVLDGGLSEPQTPQRKLSAGHLPGQRRVHGPRPAHQQLQRPLVDRCGRTRLGK